MAGFDWSQLMLIEADGEAVAVCLCNDQFVPDENCGYVPVLVIDVWRTVLTV